MMESDPMVVVQEIAGRSDGPRASEPKWQWVKRDVIRRLLAGQFSADKPIWTLRDLAEEYGVSLITVCRVYRELTKENLIRSVQGHGTFMVKKYAGKKIKMFNGPHEGSSASMMGSRKHAELLRGVSRQVDTLGAELVLLSTENIEGCFVKGDLVVLPMDFRNNPDFYKVMRALIKKYELVCVLPLAIKPFTDVSTVNENISAAVRLLTEHALARGHRRIGLLLDGMNVPWSHEKFDGYYNTLKANAISLDFQLIYEVNRHDSNFANGLNALLSLPNPPSAILVEDDLRALSVLRTCQEKGLRVPEDIAIAGLHNFYESGTCEPGLTTVDTLWAEQGALAIRLLIQCVEEKRKEAVSIAVQPKLVIRESL